MHLCGNTHEADLYHMKKYWRKVSQPMKNLKKLIVRLAKVRHWQPDNRFRGLCTKFKYLKTLDCPPAIETTAFISTSQCRIHCNLFVICTIYPLNCNVFACVLLEVSNFLFEEESEFSLPVVTIAMKITKEKWGCRSSISRIKFKVQTLYRIWWESWTCNTGA